MGKNVERSGPAKKWNMISAYSGIFHGSTVVRTVGLDLRQDLPDTKQRFHPPRSWYSKRFKFESKTRKTNTNITNLVTNSLQYSQKYAFRFTDCQSSSLHTYCESAETISFLIMVLQRESEITLKVEGVQFCESPPLYPYKHTLTEDIIICVSINWRYYHLYRVPGSSVGIATGYGLDGTGSNPGGDEIFRPSRPALGAHTASCTMGAESFPGVKCGRGVLLTTHPLLLPRSWKSRAVTLPTIWATPGL